MLTATLMILAAAAAQQVPRDAPPGTETTIPFANSGAIQQHVVGEPGSNTLYLRDRTLRWYRVTLTGDCLPDRIQTTLIYRTGPDGRFDRLSRVGSTYFPNRFCGVTSIVTSDPPAEAQTPRR